MKDTELYAQILGLKKPREVRAVRLEVSAKKMEVELGCKAKTWWGNEEGERLLVYDHVERRWRHLATCGFATELVCRVQKPDGKVEVVSVPWGEKGPRFTSLLFPERAVLRFGADRSGGQPGP